MFSKLIYKYRRALLYGAFLALLVSLLKWLEWKFVVINYSLEIYITCIAIIFTALGIWLARRLSSPKIETRIKTVVVEKEVFLPNKSGAEDIDAAQREKLNLSSRELEVLQLMASGMSNQEIASQLFLSLNTVKTHCSKLFEKLDVNRRTQAVEKSKRLRIIT